MTREEIKAALDREYKKYLQHLESLGQIYPKTGRMTEYADAATDGYDYCQQSILKIIEIEDDRNEK